jgi:hypothetical protein
MIQLPSMSFRLIEAEREHLPIVVGRAFAGRNTAPYLASGRGRAPALDSGPEGGWVWALTALPVPKPGRNAPNPAE